MIKVNFKISFDLSVLWLSWKNIERFWSKNSHIYKNQKYMNIYIFLRKDLIFACLIKE